MRKESNIKLNKLTLHFKGNRDSILGLGVQNFQHRRWNTEKCTLTRVKENEIIYIFISIERGNNSTTRYAVLFPNMVYISLPSFHRWWTRLCLSSCFFSRWRTETQTVLRQLDTQISSSLSLHSSHTASWYYAQFCSLFNTLIHSLCSKVSAVVANKCAYSKWLTDSLIPWWYTNRPE
jgi:hypothetical protein